MKSSMSAHRKTDINDSYFVSAVRFRRRVFVNVFVKLAEKGIDCPLKSCSFDDEGV